MYVFNIYILSHENMSNTVYQFLLFFPSSSSSFSSTFDRQFRVRSFSVIGYSAVSFFFGRLLIFGLKGNASAWVSVLVGGSSFFLFYLFVAIAEYISPRKCERACRCMIYSNVYYGFAAHECFVL